MPTLIALCGYSDSGREQIARCLSGYKAVGLLDAAKFDLAPIFKKMPPHTPEHERRLLATYRQVSEDISPGCWHRRLKLPASDAVAFDVATVGDVKYLHDHGAIFFHVVLAGAGPADAVEARELNQILSGFSMPEIQNDSTPMEAAARIIGWMADREAA